MHLADIQEIAGSTLRLSNQIMRKPAIDWARKATREELEDEVVSLTVKVQFLLNTYVNDSEDGTFTFYDGDTWEIMDTSKGGWRARED